jgi:molecular chaperone Hsp33
MMNTSEPPIDSIDDFSGNILRPFQLEASSLRGRIVRFNDVLNEIVAPHNYPEVVSQLLAETITLCALLSSMLKYEGIFTLQTQGDGPISMLVADMTSDGAIRGCATFNEERLEAMTKQFSAFSEDIDASSDNHLAQLLGKGYIAFTVDPFGDTERYQGIVELKGKSLTDCVQHYFSQSEQINTGIKMAAAKRDGKWFSSGIMLQHMPEEGGTQSVSNVADNLDEDDWRRAMILMGSCTEAELLHPDLNSHNILIRLFHEEGVRVFKPTRLYHSCRCSDEKVEKVVTMMSEEDRRDMVVDGKIILKCEFCSKDYQLDPADVEKKAKLMREGDTPA